MATSLSTRTFLSILFLLSVAPAAGGEDTQTGPKTEEPAVVTKNLAAFQAFRQLIASRRYAVSEDQLAGMVKKHLQESKAKPPLPLPKLADLQTSGLKRDFQARYDEMLKKATSKLDPDGKLKLEERLRNYLKQHPKLRNDAETRYQEYAKKELPKALGRVNKTLVAQQVKQLNGRLEKYLGSGKPAVGKVQSAFEENAQCSLSQLIKKEVLDDVKLALPRLLPADEAFGKSVDKVASDSIRQLKEQLETLKKPEPESRTLEGIRKELHVRLDGKAGSQKKDRQKDRLRRSYGKFPLAQKQVETEARRHFDRQVEAATEQVLGAVKNGKQPIPEEHKHKIHVKIVGDLPKHHELKKSKDELKKTIKDLVEEAGRQWIFKPLMEAAKQSRSEHDLGYDPVRFNKDVDGLLEKVGTAAHEAWIRLSDLLTKEYEETLIPTVRARIAKQHAKQYSPLLAAGAWLPTEEQILDLKGPLQRRQLRALDVWLDKPPAQDEDVLEETWQQWTGNAKHAFAIGQQAMTGQQGLVVSLKDFMFERISDGLEEGRDHWVNEYTLEVSSRWKPSLDSAAKHYPGLFDKTQLRIKEVVALLFQQAKKQQEEAEKLAVKRREEAEKLAAKKREEAEKRTALERKKTEPPAESEPQAQPPAETGPRSDG